MAHHVIYVPGLGDSKTFGQDIAIQFWRLFGFIPHYFALGWANKEGFEIKLGRLLTSVDDLEHRGHRVSLVGASAGASAVLNAFARREKVRGVVCICGKIQRPQTVSPQTYLNNPDFKESMSELSGNLNNLEVNKILSLRPWGDHVVALEDMLVNGATHKTIPGWSHGVGVLSGIIFGAPIIARFLRQKN